MSVPLLRKHTSVAKCFAGIHFPASVQLFTSMTLCNHCYRSVGLCTAVPLGVSTGTGLWQHYEDACAFWITSWSLWIMILDTPPPPPNHNCHHLSGASSCDRYWQAVSLSLPPSLLVGIVQDSSCQLHPLTGVLFLAPFFHSPVPAGCHMLPLERRCNLLHDSLYSHMGTAKWAVVPFICLGKLFAALLNFPLFS